MLIYVIIFLNTFFLVSSIAPSGSTPTMSNIFCSGKILHYVQMSRVFNDSKYFVDMKSKFSPEIIKNDFDVLLNKTHYNPDKEILRAFVDDNFEPPGTEFEPWVPKDWKIKPKFLDKIYDVHLQNWAKDLNFLWKKLGRLIRDDVLKNSSMYSQIYVPYPFVVPGGKFREFYYWDSYWIIEGLLLSEMFDTVQGMLMNFLYLVELYGYIPNGGRLYYLERSQPPLLIPMVNLYWEASKDYTFLNDSIDILEKEFNFWINNRSVTIVKDGIEYSVFQYSVHSEVPRPESYYEDTINAESLKIKTKSHFYSEIKSAAESGWDFSSRWFIADGKRTKDLKDINTSNLAHICLNSMMGLNANLLAKFYTILGNTVKSEEYKLKSESINKTISRVFWNEEEGIWFDYNIVTGYHQTGFYASNFLPIWTEMYGMERDLSYISERVLSYMTKMNITEFPGGVPTSLVNSSQQWDMPNGWAPLQYFTVLGLRKLGKINAEAASLAYSLADKWVRNCYETYINSDPHSMYEKYDVTKTGIPGGGGEYPVQEGFGWTNGVALKFLTLYGNKIETSRGNDPAPVTIGSVLFIISLAAMANLVYRLKVKNKMSHKFFKLKNTNTEENFV